MSECVKVNMKLAIGILGVIIMISILSLQIGVDEQSNIVTSNLQGNQNSHVSKQVDSSYEHAYSLWLQPPIEIYRPLKLAMDKLAYVYNGTYHLPHCTLFGAVYTSNESFVIDITKQIAKKLTPFTLAYDHAEVKYFNPYKRWRAGLTIKYKASENFTVASKLAADLFHSTDVQKPHTSVVYDFDGKTAEHYNLPTDFENMVKSASNLNLSTMTWQVTEVHVYYTPLRQYWKSSEDQRMMVNMWRKIATFPFDNR